MTTHTLNLRERKENLGLLFGCPLILDMTPIKDKEMQDEILKRVNKFLLKRLKTKTVEDEGWGKD